jgi:hypothetical protein
MDEAINAYHKPVTMHADAQGCRGASANCLVIAPPHEAIAEARQQLFENSEAILSLTDDCRG